MASQTWRFPNRRHAGQERRAGNQENQMDRRELVEEINRLTHLLNVETAKFMNADSKVFQLSKELHETKLQLEKQKNLTEMYIRQDKEKKKELETLQKYADEETLNPAKIAFQVQSEIKHRKKKLLQKDYEELQVAHVISQKKFSSEILMEKDKNKALQEELDGAKISYQELKQEHDTDILAARQEKETLQGQIKSHVDKMAQDQQIIVDLRAELDTLHQQMEQARALLQQISKETEMRLQVELEHLKDSSQELRCRHEADVQAAREEAERLQRELEEMKVYVEDQEQ